MRRTLIPVLVLGIATAGYAQKAQPTQRSEKGQSALASSDVDSSLNDDINYAEFLVDGPLPSTVHSQYTALLQQEYREHPPTAAERRNAHENIAKVRLIADPVRLGETREATWRNIKEAIARRQDPYLAREVSLLRSAPNVIGDTGGGDLITVEDAKAQVASDRIIAQMAGIKGFDDADAAKYVSYLRANWAAQPRQQLEYLSTAMVRLAALKAMLRDGSKMRNSVLNDIHAHVRGYDDVGAMARAQEQVGLRYVNLQREGPALLGQTVGLGARAQMMQHAYLAFK